MKVSKNSIVIRLVDLSIREYQSWVADQDFGVLWFSNLNLTDKPFRDHKGNPNLSVRASGAVCVMQKLEAPVPHTQSSREWYGVSCEMHRSSQTPLPQHTPQVRE